MPEAAISRSDRELQMLEALVDCAHGLAMAFGKAAHDEGDHRRSLELVDAFHRSALAVRMGIRLSLTLRAAQRAAPARADAAERIEVERAEREAPETERPDSERPERPEIDRERDRDYEPVSLPRFLATLGVVAKAAERLGDRLPAAAADALPALRHLLAETGSPAPAPAAGRLPGVDLLVRPPPASARPGSNWPASPRAALLGSAAPPAIRPSDPRGPGLPRPPPRASG